MALLWPLVDRAQSINILAINRYQVEIANLSQLSINYILQTLAVLVLYVFNQQQQLVALI